MQPTSICQILITAQNDSMMLIHRQIMVVVAIHMQIVVGLIKAAAPLSTVVQYLVCK